MTSLIDKAINNDWFDNFKSDTEILISLPFLEYPLVVLLNKALKPVSSIHIISSKLYFFTSSNVNFVNSKNIKSDFVQADNSTSNKRILIDFFKPDTDSNQKTNIKSSSALSKANTIFKQSVKSFLNIDLEEAE